MKQLKLIALAIATMLTMSTVNGQEYNMKAQDTKSENLIIVGAADVEGIKSMGTWFDEGYALYNPDKTVVDSIKLYQNQYPDVFVVLGTWCGDSKEHVPHFYKLMDQLDYPKDKIFMVGVDREKKGGDFCLADFNILYVPTFIFTYRGEEIGRIIEAPLFSLEQDLLNILRTNATRF